MAKWINTATGLEVPAAEVRELAPGTGLFVHEASVAYNRIVPTDRDPGRGFIFDVEVQATTARMVDGFAVRLQDGETYDPAVHSVQVQVAAAQAAQREQGAA